MITLKGFGGKLAKQILQKLFVDIPFPEGRFSTVSLCITKMTKILLNIELGDWDGGHNGQYPKLIEWNLEEMDRPIEESEGWGHGLGGGSYSLNTFMQSKSFYCLGQGDSVWAHKIISEAVQKGVSTSKISELLSNEAVNHKISIPNQLLQSLTRGVRYINA